MGWVMKMDELKNRKTTRLKGADYNRNQAVFLTICTKDRKCILSRVVGTGVPVKSKIVNSCARGLYTHFMFEFYAFGSRTECSGERLPKAAHGLIEARNAAVKKLLCSQIKLCDLVVAVAERGKIRTLKSQFQFRAHHRFA